MRGIVLLGHGSKVPGFEEVMEYHRDRIDRMGIFEEIEVAYVITEPGILEVVNSMRSDEVYIVPIFISHGAHMEELPSIFGLKSRCGTYNTKKLFICDPIGKDSLITYAILNRIFEVSEEKDSQ